MQAAEEEHPGDLPESLIDDFVDLCSRFSEHYQKYLKIGQPLGNDRFEANKVLKEKLDNENACNLLYIEIVSLAKKALDFQLPAEDQTSIAAKSATVRMIRSMLPQPEPADETEYITPFR